VFVQVALPLPVFHSFTYAVPAELRGRAVPGARVLVPFGRSERIGWIEAVGEGGEGARRGTVRELHGILDPEPTVPPSLLSLCRWIADYYIAPLGQVLRSALPAALSDSSADWVALREPHTAPAADAGSPLEREILEWLSGTDGPQAVSRLRRERGDRAWWPAIRRLEEAGVIDVGTDPPRVAPAVQTRRVVRLVAELPSLTERERVFARAPRQRECFETLEAIGGVAELAHLTGALGFSDSVVRGLVSRELATAEHEEVARDPYTGIAAAAPLDLRPTAAQAAALDALTAAARDGEAGTWLLRGVTGSGKTLVYIELLREVVGRQGRTAIVLVPEIALTPQTVGRFKAVFGDRVAVLHSALSDGERYDEWRALRSGEKRIVVGARSAVFAPLPDLGAVIVDEEHEGSYKQGEAPRYHAREVAAVRARMAGAICLLGSATPSLESWANAESGKFRLLELPARVEGRPLPAVRVVDLRAERKRRAEGPPGAARGPVVLSAELEGAVSERLRRGEQSILLLNRRGYSTFVQCRECGAVWHCPSCNVSLTYHRRRGRLTCHHCFHDEPRPERCTGCGGSDLGFSGVGTEQVERTVEETFASARVARMDVDTTSGKWAHHRILERVERGEVDILLGTQMIAKGLDFPNVTLVGVINADVGMNLPDFRATERTFQLMTQVAGRAGRGEKGGEVLIQTSLPEHYAVTCAVRHEFVEFAARELETRRAPSYPPFSRLVNVVFSGLDERATQDLAESAARWLRDLVAARGLDGLEVVGPAPCPIDRIRRRWRWHLLLRSASTRLVGEVARFFVERFDAPRGRDQLRIAVDRDPVALL
jgi:primosomal protein N' (replication factor Y) (superfamily II helicase)